MVDSTVQAKEREVGGGSGALGDEEKPDAPLCASRTSQELPSAARKIKSLLGLELATLMMPADLHLVVSDEVG